MRYFNKTLGLVLSLLVLAGCVAVPTGEVAQREAKGDKAGKIVVFALQDLNKDEVGFLLNKQFIQPMTANRQFTQSLCSGSYQAEARYLVPQMQAGKVARVKNQTMINVKPQQTTYLEVARVAKGWVVNEVSQQHYERKTANVKMEDTDITKHAKLVRRLTDAMVKCD